MGYIRNVVLTVVSVIAAGIYSITLFVSQFDSRESPPVSYDQLLENSPDGHILLDDDDTVLDVNSAARNILDSRDLSSGVDLTRALPEVTPLVSESNTSRKECIVDVGTDRKYLDARYVPISDGDGRADHLLTFRVATDRRRTEKQYRELIENASDLVVVLDRDGKVTFADQSPERVLGYGPDELLGRTLREEIHPDDRDKLESEFEQLLEESAESRRFEFRIQADDGEWRVFEAIGRNLLDNPLVDGIVLNSRDITKRKQREYDLERQNERLDEFARVLSHDIRSPLQVANLHLEQAERTGDEEAFQKAKQAQERIETILDDVLALARHGQTISETTMVDLETVAREAWNTVDTREMTLNIEGSRDLEADRDRLQQLFENLFRNATEHAGPDATVCVGPVEPMHTTTRIDTNEGRGFYVSDDGPGIPEDIREKVFDSGFTTESDGTGFGLAIVAQIAEAHRWEPKVSDSRDSGTRFEFIEKLADSYLGVE